MAKKILLIDDDPDALDMLELFLYKSYDIITATDGFDGITKAEKELPDLIATDITMPVMDGIRLFNRIRKSEHIKGTPVIAVTSFAKNVTVKSLMKMGFCAVIPKPIVRDVVENTVAAAFNNVKTQKKG